MAALTNPCDPVVLLLLLQTEFTPLHQWEREYIIFEKLHRKPHFMHFRMWKQFALWRRAVRTRKTTEARYDTKHVCCQASFTPALHQQASCSPSLASVAHVGDAPAFVWHGKALTKQTS